MAKFKGTSGGDDFVGTAFDDTFVLHQGGNDLASGLDGNDTFRMGATLESDDLLYGGTGTDKVVLLGDYSSFVFDSVMINSIEILRLNGAFDYNLTLNEASVAAGERLTVNAGPLTAGNNLTFDGSAETDGSYRIFAGEGDDDIIGSANRDNIYLARSSTDIVDAGGGDDVIHMGAALDATDQIDGGSNFGLDRDRVLLKGDYFGVNAVTLTDTTLVGIEVLKVSGSYIYDITTADGTVDSLTNLTLTVNAIEVSGGAYLIFDGSAETDSNFSVFGSSGDDIVAGGAFGDTINGRGGSDTITGGGGLDTLTGGGGGNTYVVAAAADSTGTGHDIITDFDAVNDQFDFPVIPSFVDFKAGSVSSASFNTDLASIIGDSLSAVVIDVIGGDYAGRTLLVVDGNGNFTYAAGDDFVFDITGLFGAITTGNFI